MRRIWATPGLDDLPVAEWKALLGHLSTLGFMGIEPLIAGPYGLSIGTIEAAVDVVSEMQSDMVIIARTDAATVEGLDAAIGRGKL